MDSLSLKITLGGYSSAVDFLQPVVPQLQAASLPLQDCIIYLPALSSQKRPTWTTFPVPARASEGRPCRITPSRRVWHLAVPNRYGILNVGPAIYSALGWVTWGLCLYFCKPFVPSSFSLQVDLDLLC
jgi:hypothetical protein